MTMILDGEEHAITPAVWEIFERWYGDKAYRQAGVVTDIEAAVRAQVATEEGSFLRDGRDTYQVVETELVDPGSDYWTFKVWVERPAGEEDE